MIGRLISWSLRRLITIGAIAGVAVVAVLLIVLWQVGVFDSAPPPATIESAVESLREDDEQAQVSATDAQQEGANQDAAQSETADAAVSADDQQLQDSYQVQSYDTQETVSESGQATQDSQDDSAQSTQADSNQSAASVAPPTLDELAGPWTLSAQGESFVGYRIGEELANIGTTTAVGRTADIVASLEFDGETITSVIIEADLRTLRSDQSFRDSALRTRGIESDTFPFATFTLTEPIPIDALPSGEDTLSVTVQGALDLHGVTNSVSIALDGQLVDGLVVVVGSTEIALADYDIEKPTGFRVLSIEDVGIMEFQLVFEPSP